MQHTNPIGRTSNTAPPAPASVSAGRKYDGLVEVTILVLAGLAVSFFALSHPEFGDALLLLGQYGS
jgi:hypothetical protein